jgi:hypothetical protein
LLHDPDAAVRLVEPLIVGKIYSAFNLRKSAFSHALLNVPEIAIKKPLLLYFSQHVSGGIQHQLSFQL